MKDDEIRFPLILEEKFYSMKKNPFSKMVMFFYHSLPVKNWKRIYVELVEKNRIMIKY